MPEPGLNRGRGASTGRSVKTAAKGKAEPARHASTAYARDVAADPEPWPQLPDGHDSFDEDDAPPEDGFPDFPKDDDEDVDGAGLSGDAPPPSRRRLPAQITLFLGRNGVRDHQVAALDLVRHDDPAIRAKLVDRQRYLKGLASALVTRLPSEVLGATSVAEAFDRLPVWAQADLAEMLDLSPTSISRDKNMVVATPGGRVPLQFFFWRTEADRLVGRLAAWQDLQQPWSSGTVRSAAAHVVDLAPSRDTIRQLLPWVQAAVARPDIALAFRIQIMEYPQETDELLARYASALIRHQAASGGPVPDVKRGAAVRNRALVGGF